MTFTPGKDYVAVSGRVYDQSEVEAACEVVKSGWWTCADVTRDFEHALAEYLGVPHVAFCNSGSSANLLAMSALAERAEGMPVVTTAVAFPTTVSAILHAGLRPVFVDVDLGTYNANSEQVLEAIAEQLKRSTRVGLLLAHTLGVPWDLGLLDQIRGLDRNRVLVVEDNCDALGAEWKGKKTGSFGLASTLSFFPAHHITTGEGGAVCSTEKWVDKAVRSYRDWGRDCWCEPGKDNSCKKRFSQKHGELPQGYDHKYVFSRMGYNLKATDIQAAIGLAQMDKIEGFVETRMNNWCRLYRGLCGLKDHFILPKVLPHAESSPFGFALTVKPKAGFTRLDLVRYLEEKKIGTRLMFAGNILKQPGFQSLVSKKLPNTDIVMNDTFWLGCWPGLTAEMLDYVINNIHTFVKEH